METVIQNAWSKSKLLIKGVIIFFTALALSIPALYVENLIQERENRQKEAIQEVSNKWAGSQTITGPALILPYTHTFTDAQDKTVTTNSHAYFLPDVLDVKSTVSPLEKHRGIYKVMLYSANVRMEGRFDSIDLSALDIDPASVKWKDAYFRMGISDVRGLNEELNLVVNGRPLHFTNQVAGQGEEGLVAPAGFTGLDDLNNIVFSTEAGINGSGQLLFSPVGKSTTVEMKSVWPHPSFTGNMLPQQTQVNDTGFTAVWKSLSHKRSFPQQWKNDINVLKQERNYDNGGANVNAAAFGAGLFIPVNGYQKTMRSVKYALLCIMLTFAAFFLIEINQKKSIHPFQYALVGVALILFYTLLLSISEYTGFNLAYLVASVCTIGLIGWFVKGLMGSGKPAALLSGILVLLYTYIFTILQLQDYSLLLGSIGLFLSLAVIMHFSKKFSW